MTQIYANECGNLTVLPKHFPASIHSRPSAGSTAFFMEREHEFDKTILAISEQSHFSSI